MPPGGPSESAGRSSALSPCSCLQFSAEGPVGLPPVARKHFVRGPIIAGVVALAVVILPALVFVKSADLQKLSAAGVAAQEMTGFRVLRKVMEPALGKNASHG